MQKNQQLISGIYTATNGNGMMADNGLGGSSVTHIDSPGINRIFTIANNSTDEMLFNTLSYAFVKQREFRVLIINDIITAVWFNDVAEPTPALSIPDFKFRVQKFTSAAIPKYVHKTLFLDLSVD